MKPAPTLPIYLQTYIESYAGYINDPFIDFHRIELHFARFPLSAALVMMMGTESIGRHARE